MAKVAREKDRMGKTNNDRFPDGLRSWLNGPKCNCLLGLIIGLVFRKRTWLF